MSYIELDGEKLELGGPLLPYGVTIWGFDDIRKQIKRERKSAQRLTAAFGTLTTMNGIGPEPKK